jgi:uncharacterized DUF497 family protein
MQDVSRIGAPAGSVCGMHDAEIIWDLDDDPDGNVQHIAEHGVTVEEVEEVLSDPSNMTVEDRKISGRWVTEGDTADGRHLRVVWETALDDPLTIYPITAFDAPRRRRRRK